MDLLAAMRTFVAIVDEGSLTAAAEALDRAPPTVVRSLALLETHLGTRLLQRTTRAQHLTDDGREYLVHCRRILGAVADAEQAMAPDDDRDLRGTVRVTAPVLFGQRHVLPVITDYARRHARVRIEFMLLDRVTNLVEEGFDLGVRIGPLPDSTLIARHAGHMRRVVVASPDYLDRHGTPTHPDQLETHQCVLFRGLTAGTSWAFEIGGRRVTRTVHGAFVCNHAAAAVEACRAGLGLGSFLDYQVRDAVDAGQLVRLLVDFELPPVPVSIVRPEGRLTPPRVRRLADALATSVKSTLDDWTDR